MTDIWRSLIAQRIGWENNWLILFHGPTVSQQRNEHNIKKDFADEIPGYLHTENIQKILEGLSIKAGAKNIPGSMRLCYEQLANNGIVGQKELVLLEAWLDDLTQIGIG